MRLIKHTGHINHWGIKRCLANGGDVYAPLQEAGIDGQGIQVVTATGRATCRLSGKKIPKGAKAITGIWDFYGYGSHTCTQIYIDYDTYFEKCMDQFEKEELPEDEKDLIWNI